MASSVKETRPGNRSAVVRTRFTEDEHAVVKRAAERAGLTPAAFMREAALNVAKGEPAREVGANVGPQSAPALERETVVHLRKVGTNLNQIARAVNAGRVRFSDFDSVELLHVLDSLLDDIARLTKGRRA